MAQDNGNHPQNTESEYKVMCWNLCAVPPSLPPTHTQIPFPCLCVTAMEAIVKRSR